jgi:hypothetical protein
MSYLNAQVIRDLILERESDLSDCPFVNRSVISWPPEPLCFTATVGLRGYLQAEDWFYERSLRRSGTRQRTGL